MDILFKYYNEINIITISYNYILKLDFIIEKTNIKIQKLKNYLQKLIT